jgi:hypothetical protein
MEVNWLRGAVGEEVSIEVILAVTLLRRRSAAGMGGSNWPSVKM